jgi:hypothetical protein
MSRIWAVSYSPPGTMKWLNRLSKRLSIAPLLLELAINCYLLSVVLLSVRILVDKSTRQEDAAVWFFLIVAAVVLTYAFLFIFIGGSSNFPQRLRNVGLFVAILALSLAWFPLIHDFASTKGAPWWSVYWVHIAFAFAIAMIVFEALVVFTYLAILAITIRPKVKHWISSSFEVLSKKLIRKGSQPMSGGRTQAIKKALESGQEFIIDEGDRHRFIYAPCPNDGNPCSVHRINKSRQVLTRIVFLCPVCEKQFESPVESLSLH